MNDQQRQQVIDRLQVLALRAQRVQVTTKQQQQDVDAIVDAVREATALLQRPEAR